MKRWHKFLTLTVLLGAVTALIAWTPFRGPQFFESEVNFSKAVKGTYFTVTIHHEGQETATLNPLAAFQMPFAATLVEVSAHARDIDYTTEDETYTIDIEEAGTSVLSAAKAITADDTAVVATIVDSNIADNAKIEVVLTLGGTTPTIDDLTVLLTFQAR